MSVTGTGTRIVVQNMSADETITLTVTVEPYRADCGDSDCGGRRESLDPALLAHLHDCGGDLEDARAGHIERSG